MEDIEVRNVPMLIAATSATALWLLVMLAVRIFRQPVQAEPGPATSDLGSESPAVANMLANDFQVEREAVPATLLDLAARGVVDIQGVGDMYAVHLRGREAPADLTDYERRVLQLLRSRADDGAVPARALTTGPRERARRWWKDFRKEVIADAKARGLSRDLWDGPVLSWLSAAALVPAPFVYLAFDHLAVAIAYGVVALGFIGVVQDGGRQRHTDAGLGAAAGWLGVQRYLREEPAFPDLPPTAVAVWERYLAYGAALGAAQAAVRAIPMGADEDRRAWSAYGGRWRLVRIRYPRLWPPAWGRRPWIALLAVLPIGLLAAALFSLAFTIGWPDPTPGAPGLAVGLRILVFVLLAIAVLAAAWSATTLVRAASDLGSAEEVTGLVLRLREFGGGENSQPRCYVAIDDGRSPMIRAWRVRPEIYRFAPLEEYSEATATVTPRLGHVRDIRR